MQKLISKYYLKMLKQNQNNKTVKIKDFCSVQTGKRPNGKISTNNNQFLIPLYGASKIMGYTNQFLYDEEILMVGRVGTLGIVQYEYKKCWPSDNVLVIRTEFINFTYQLLCQINYEKLNKGSSQPLITQTDIANYKVNFFNIEILKVFEDQCNKFKSKIINLKLKNIKLTELKQLYLKKFF